MKIQIHHPWTICLLIVLSACEEIHYSIADFSSVKKIDTHTHFNSESTAFAVQASKDNFQLLDVSVDVSSYLPLDEQQQIALLQIKQNPDRIRFLTAFSLKGWDSANWADKTISKLKMAFENGALGIKLWKNIGMGYKDSAGRFIMIDNPKFDPVINYIVKSDKTVMGHLGEPKNCWLPLDQMTVNNDRNYFKEHPEYHMFLHPEYPTYEKQIEARDRLLERHPDMRFVGAHLGSLEWSLDELGNHFDKFSNLAVDMAARIPHLQYLTISGREKVREFFIKYQDRLTYGSDSELSPKGNPEEEAKKLHETWLRDWKYFVTDETMTVEEVNGSFKGLKLPKEVVDKIYYKNAVKWFRFK